MNRIADQSIDTEIELAFHWHSPRRYDCAVTADSRIPPNFCERVIEIGDPYVQLVVDGMVVHHYCLSCAHVIWKICPSQ